jgi:hypothetical protein
VDDTQELGPGLLAVFAALPDTRGRQGRRHSLPAILALSTAAMLSGARSLYAIGQWGRLQSPNVLRGLGFTRSATPSVSTLHVVFRGLDVIAFETALSHWAQARAPNRPRVAIDGKGLRGIHGEELPGVRLIAAYCDEAGLVLAQKGGPDRHAGG